MGPNLVRACAAGELDDDTSVVVKLADVGRVAVFRVGDEYFAIEDRCSHQRAWLSEGFLEPELCAVECPIHASLFDLRTGAPSNPPAVQPVRVFPTRIVDGEVHVVALRAAE
ncbi:MAG: non-heme iron oxygenase ferredoxin subunit [Microbacteriaceae bacterium]